MVCLMPVNIILKLQQSQVFRQTQSWEGEERTALSHLSSLSSWTNRSENSLWYDGEYHYPRDCPGSANSTKTSPPSKAELKDPIYHSLPAQSPVPAYSDSDESVTTLDYREEWFPLKRAPLRASADLLDGMEQSRVWWTGLEQFP